MAEALKNLGQVAPAANVWVELTPFIESGKSLVLSTINVCNFSWVSAGSPGAADNFFVKTVLAADADPSDSFTRADSASTMGTTETASKTWTAGAGTWGISSNKAYSVTDAANDRVTVDFGTGRGDGTFRYKMSGDLTGGTDFRHIAGLCRYIDASNYLYVYLYEGNVVLAKLDANVLTVLSTVAQTTADATEYTVDIVLSGTSVTVMVDGVTKITHTLAGGDATKYTNAYTTYGFRLFKGGTPTSIARVDDVAFVGTDLNRQKNYWATPVDAQDAFSAALGKTLSSGDRVWVKSLNGTCSFEANGSSVDPNA